MSVFEQLLGGDMEQARERRVFGLVTAIVRSMQADGTYELQYLSMASDQPSAPARVMMPMAGAQRGIYFLPEPGDEVIVAFEAGDMNQPVILGAVWNQNDDPPPQVNTPPENNIRSIVSRSGHELSFDDTPGTEKITVKTKGGHTIVLDDTPPGKVTISSAGGSAIEFDDAAATLRLRSTAILELSAQVLTINTTSFSMTASGGAIVTTTGSAPASGFVIDGKPFGLHVHTPPVIPPAGTTGPVAP
jgi:phage baseplate assembly protein gpV